MEERFDKQLQMRVDDGFLGRIDDWRRQQAPIPSRAEAIRRLVSWGLVYSSELDFREEEARKRELRRLRDAAKRRP